MPSCAAPSPAVGRILGSDNRRSTKLWAEVRASRRPRSYRRDSSTKPSVIRPFLVPSSIPTRVIRMVAGRHFGRELFFAVCASETTSNESK